LSGENKPVIGPGTVAGFLLLNSITVLMALAWLSMFMLTAGMAKSTPSAIQYLENLWPALLGLALAAISLILAFQWSRLLGFLVAIAGIAVVPVAFLAMMP
jgi:hypothetical protein